jgi:hypothetical protein
VFLYAYGYKVPDQIKDEIRNSVLDNYFYRHDMSIDWEYAAPDANKLMLVKRRYSYTLVNNSNDSREWPFRFTEISADDYKAVAQATFCILKVQRKGGEITVYKPEQMETTLTPGQPHMRTISVSIKMDARESVDIHYEVMHMRRTFGDDKYNCRDAVVGRTRVRVRFPANSEFEVTACCKTKPLQVAADSDPPSLYSFEYNEGIFPHQGISICWSTKQEVEQKQLVVAEAKADREAG